MSEMKDSHVNVVVSFKYIMQVQYHSSMRIIVLKSTVRLRIVPHFSSGIVERAKRARVKINPREKRRHAPFLAWVDFHARSHFARSTIPEEKWGTTRSLKHC